MKISHRALAMWTIVSLLMVVHFFLLLSVGVITTELRDDLGLTALQLSFLSSSYLYVYILLQTPAGILLDEFGPRKLLTVGALVSSIGCWVFARSNSLELSILARILMGSGLAFVFIASILLASRWFAARYLGLMIGLSEAAGMVGAFVGSMLLAIFITKLGWRDSFVLCSALLLMLAVLTWLFVHDSPNTIVTTEIKKLNLSKVKANMHIVLRDPQMWLHSIYVALMYVSITVFSGLWANPFLRRAFDLSLEQATFACCLVLAGIGIGSPVAGIIFKTERSQITCIRLCAVLMFVAMCLLLYIPVMPFYIINILMLVLGVAGSSLVLSFAIISNTARDGAKSTTIGFANALSLVSAIVFQPVVGWILNLLSSGDRHGLEYYSASNYRVALSVLPVLIFLAFVFGEVIARRYRLSQHQQ